MNITFIEQKNFTVRNCYFNYLVQISQQYTGTDNKLFMVCAEYQGTNITMSDTVPSDNPTNSIKSIFALPYSNIIEFSYDSK